MNIKQKAKMLMETEIILKKSEQTGKKMHLHILNYSDGMADDEQTSEEWEGRLRLITNQTEKILSNIREQGLNVEYIEEILPEHSQKIQSVENKIDRIEMKMHDVEKKVFDQMQQCEIIIEDIFKYI